MDAEAVVGRVDLETLVLRGVLVPRGWSLVVHLIPVGVRTHVIRNSSWIYLLSGVEEGGMA